MGIYSYVLSIKLGKVTHTNTLTHTNVVSKCYCSVTTGKVNITVDTTTELSGTDEEDKRGQSDYH